MDKTDPHTGVQCLSLKLDCFVLNKHLFEDEAYQIAPLNIPDHSSFLPGEFSGPDAIHDVDLHSTRPWSANSRIADVSKLLGSGDSGEQNLRTERLGVYLHWCLPRRFREGQAVDKKQDQGLGVREQHGVEAGVKYTEVPDRWIIIRFIAKSDKTEAPALTAFMVESNRIRRLGDEEVADMEQEAAPFIDRSATVEQQAEVFLGMKHKFQEAWVDPDPKGQYHSPLTIVDSANPLFADFQHHNFNVFSIHDDLSWSDDGKTLYAETTAVSYAVFGYISHATAHERLVCHGSLFNVLWNRNKAPDLVEASTTGQVLLKKQTVALGQDSLEAIQAYLQAYEDPDHFDWFGLFRESRQVIRQAGQAEKPGLKAPQDARSGFKPVSGGTRWRLKDGRDEVKQAPKPGELQAPVAGDMQLMYAKDTVQAFRDALDRHDRYLRHRLFCEWWKRRSQTPGSLYSRDDCQLESTKRINEAMKQLKTTQELLNKCDDTLKSGTPRLIETTRPEFFSRMAPAVIIGGMGTPWPSEFFQEQQDEPRDLKSLPLKLKDGKTALQTWLAALVDNSGQATGTICADHGMKNFFKSATEETPWKEGASPEVLPGRLRELFAAFENLDALNYDVPGWVRAAVEDLVEEWVLDMAGQDIAGLAPKKERKGLERHWDGRQPWRCLFLEWKIEYYHLPRRFWELRRKADGSAEYKIIDSINISSFDGMERHKRVMSGRSILRPNPTWILNTILKQFLSKIDQRQLGSTDLIDINKVLDQMKEAFHGLGLVAGDLDGLTDHLLTLRRGIHIIPYPPQAGDTPDEVEQSLLNELLKKATGFDVTPYGDALFSDPEAGLDFKPVTHGQARFTKFNVVDRFGQVVSPFGKDSSSLYPCLGPSLACQENLIEGPGFANSVELDKEGNSQFFQLGHSINQDCRLNSHFVVHSADREHHHPSTQWFESDVSGRNGPAKQGWRATTEYEDAVWGWLLVDFRDRGIQVYNAIGECMGEALLPGSIYGKVHWQVYYSEGDLSEEPKESQLQNLMDRMSDAKFLMGLWVMLADACQNIHHEPSMSAHGDQLLNLAGRPMALVNMGFSLELATPPMETQSYHDIRKRSPESKLSDYSFEVLLGDKPNMHDGLVGYFMPPAMEKAVPKDNEKKDKVSTVQDSEFPYRPDPSCIYTEFGYPGRTNVDASLKGDNFASPSQNPLYLSPSYHDPVELSSAMEYSYSQFNDPTSCVIIGAIVDPFQPIHVASGILPESTVKLPSWIASQTLQRMRLLFRGGPMLFAGDLPSEDDWSRPLNQTEREVAVPPVATNAGGGGENGATWSWLQPVIDGDSIEDLPTFVPYNIRETAVPSAGPGTSAEWPPPLGPHTCLEGFYKFGLKDIEADEANILLHHRSEVSNAAPRTLKLGVSASGTDARRAKHRLRGVKMGGP
ncbi:hypothetical protein QQX98_002899 [Neonectria punicea]|uniref:Uncharacterized protein n=1 Tax=Neonectria punicea TaxID=979145 RepID=A0ABR1HHC7_9HYPO